MHLDVCSWSGLFRSLSSFFSTEPVAINLVEAFKERICQPVPCFTFSLCSAMRLYHKHKFSKEYDLKQITCMWVCGLAGPLGLTPSLALYLPWASLFPSPNFPSRVWASWFEITIGGPVQWATWMFVRGLAWSTRFAPSFALNLCRGNVTEVDHRRRKNWNFSRVMRTKWDKIRTKNRPVLRLALALGSSSWLKKKWKQY